MNVSIIVLTYNSAVHLEECLDSIIDNKDKDDELIIIDNNSLDSTRKILNKYRNIADIYLLSNNLKISYARNLGAKYAKNDLLVFIDSDLVLDTNSLKKAKDSYIKNNASVLFGYYKEIGTGYDWYIEMTRDIFSPKRKNNFSKEIDYKNFACLSGGLCLINKNIFLNYNGFNVYYDNSPSEDIDLELKLIRDNKKIIYEKEFSGIHYKNYVSFNNLINKYKGNGIALSKLINSSIINKYKIPFNNRWPYLPIICLLELILLILSLMFNYFIYVLLVVIVYRLYLIIIDRNYNVIYKIKFIIIRFLLDFVMLFFLIKSSILQEKNNYKKSYDVKKI